MRAVGAIDLVAAWSRPLASACRVLVILGALSGAGIAWVNARRGARQAALVDGTAMAIAAMWIASPVLSPQYLVWGLPVFLFVAPLPRVLYLVALAITRIEYPACYPFVAHLSLPGLVLVSARNALLVAAWATLLERGAAGFSTSRSFA